MKVRYKGTCYECRQPIMPRQDIRRHAISGQMKHTNCEKAKEQACNEATELLEDLAYGYEYG